MSRLTIDALLSRAGLRAGDLTSGPWEEALDQLLTALDATAELDAMRTENTARQLAHSLAMRKRLQDAGPPPAPVRAPIVIIGFPRTGTTLLQNLLASHPDHVAHPLWALRRPLWTEDARDGAVAEAEAWLEILHKATPDFARIHPMHALRPDECSWLFRQSFASMVYAYQYLVPDYARWLASADVGWAYQEYADQLAHLGGEGRLLLKDPCHLWHLDALLDTFPDALVVHLHRPPEQAVPSLASLCTAMQSFGTADRSAADLGAYAFDLTSAAMERMMQVREARTGVNVLDLDFRELVADPVGTCTRICEAAGTATHPGVAHRIEDWLDNNPRGKHGKHSYSLEGFGLEPATVAQRFAPYVERFGAVGAEVAS